MSSSERQLDQLDPARASALAATLGMERQYDVGDPLPPFFHHIYFWQPQPADALGRDGHPRVGKGLIPDLGLPRRMWAGGRLTFKMPLLAGLQAERRSKCLKVAEKEGRSGRLAFVTLEHAVWQNGQCCLREEQDLVYRPDPHPDDPPRQMHRAERFAETTRDVICDSTMLFRYSALTFNGHRIHYDAEYARDVEGYAGAVVHGPLLAQLMMLWATERIGPLESFSFRGLAPMTLKDRAKLCTDGSAFWVENDDGHVIMNAEAAGFR